MKYIAVSDWCVSLCHAMMCHTQVFLGSCRVFTQIQNIEYRWVTGYKAVKDNPLLPSLLHMNTHSEYHKEIPQTTGGELCAAAILGRGLHCGFLGVLLHCCLPCTQSFFLALDTFLPYILTTANHTTSFPWSLKKITENFILHFKRPQLRFFIKSA